jgi:chemotaxis protein CheX
MEMDYVNPFVDGARELISSMFQSSCDITLSNSPALVDVSGVIDLDGSTPTQLALSFSRETATRMVAQLLALEQSEIDDDILGDGVGEMTNIVAGMAKKKMSTLSNTLKLSTPRVTVSDCHELSLFRANGVVHVRLTTELGDFSLRVYSNTTHKAE